MSCGEKDKRLAWFVFKWCINLQGLFNAKTILVKEQQWYYSTLSQGNKGVYTFSESECNNTAGIWTHFELVKNVISEFNILIKKKNEANELNLLG